MAFSADELELAQLLKNRGLAWTPTPGHYVLDESELIERESPFQDRIYFILDLKHFLRRAGTLEELKQRVCWLPTWEQARDLLRHQGVTDEAMAQQLRATQAIERATERLELYRMLVQVL